MKGIKLFNFKQLKKQNFGFTLIELLVVMIVLLTVGSVMLVILTSSLRGANKSTSINKVREAGNYAISQISRRLLFATCIDSFDSAVTPVRVCDEDSEYHVIRFTDGSDESSHLFSCIPALEPSLSNGKLSDLKIDDSKTLNFLGSVTDFKIKSCLITCSGGNEVSLPIINITFTMEKAGDLAVDQSAAIAFKTSVSPRNTWCPINP